MSLYVGLDIGGTKFLVASADKQGEIVHRVRAKAPNNLEQDLKTLNQMISEVTAGEIIRGMGAAIGGPLDWERGIVSPLHQPTWRNVPLKEMMESRWGCPFFVDVDTNVAALGEYFLTDIDASKFLYITLSTGMGGGFIIDGKIYRGLGGAHPEVAHQSVNFRCSNPEGVQCECGVPDCLEALVSGNGIQRIYHKPAEILNAEEWKEVAYNLGQGLRNLAVIYAPDVIRVGGGVAFGGGEAFISQARQVMQDHLRIVPAPDISLSHLGHDTTLMGAITIAIQGLDI
jgi:predicted NBD/HSP70 family sugar kinase